MKLKLRYSNNNVCWVDKLSYSLLLPLWIWSHVYSYEVAMRCTHAQDFTTHCAHIQRNVWSVPGILGFSHMSCTCACPAWTDLQHSVWTGLRDPRNQMRSVWLSSLWKNQKQDLLSVPASQIVILTLTGDKYPMHWQSFRVCFLVSDLIPGPFYQIDIGQEWWKYHRFLVKIETIRSVRLFPFWWDNAILGVRNIWAMCWSWAVWPSRP